MALRLLATDFDGTLARDGEVGSGATAALIRWKTERGLLALVTGRVLDDLLAVYGGLSIFDIVVAENGALLYWPANGRVQTLASPPPPAFVAELRRRGASPLTPGRVIVGSRLPSQGIITSVLRELNINSAIVLNKGSLMVLPYGVDKASGLRSALHELGVSRQETVGCGDAENDLPLLAECEVSVAVGNALDAVKRAADIVTTATHGEGLAEAIDTLLRQRQGLAHGSTTAAGF